MHPIIIHSKGPAWGKRSLYHSVAYPGWSCRPFEGLQVVGLEHRAIIGSVVIRDGNAEELEELLGKLPFGDFRTKWNRLTS